MIRAAELRRRSGHLMHEGAKFLAVGGIGLVIDIGLFNLLVHGTNGPLSHKPITAKVISTFVAIVVNYVGNRLWTFRHRDHAGLAKQSLIFLALSLGGMAIATGCLAISRYVLGLESALSDNIAANVVGLGLGTLFRFWSYRKWVFREVHGAIPEPVALID